MNSDYTLALDPNVWYYLLRNAGGFILVFGLAASLAFGACKAFEFIVFEIDCGFFFKPRREFSLPSKASLLPAPDVTIITKFESNPKPVGASSLRYMYAGLTLYNQVILVDFGKTRPRRCSETDYNKYESFISQGNRIHGLFVIDEVEGLDNIWECSYDYFEKLPE